MVFFEDAENKPDEIPDVETDAVNKFKFPSDCTDEGKIRKFNSGSVETLKIKNFILIVHNCIYKKHTKQAEIIAGIS